MKRLIVGVTGASGSILAKRLIETGADHCEILLVITENGRMVFRYELEQEVDEWIETLPSGRVKVFDSNDLFAPIASGSYPADGMIVVPCSMSSIAKMAHGIADTLLCRAADVCLKEKRPLILVPRETPLHAIHLKNLCTLSEAGAQIVPPMPVFYAKPKSVSDMVDALVGRILHYAGVETPYYYHWGEEK